MYVIKRNGNQEPVHFDKITNRIRKLCNGLSEDYIDPTIITSKIASGIYNGITTRELDKLAAETAAYSSTFHPDWSILAARIAVSDLHKNTTDDFAANVQKMQDYIHPITKKKAPLIAPYINKVVQENATVLNRAIKYERDFDFDYFGFKTLEKSYLLKMNGKVSERPQQMYMRVAVAIHTTFGPLIRENVDMFSKEGEENLNNQKYEFAILNVEKAIETYELMSTRFFTHATPTLFNAGTVRPQLSSCFLLQIPEDSVESIYDTLKKCAMISKYAGGIGLSMHDIRSADSYIAGTNGISNGIIPMLRVYNDTSRYIDQGGQKRKGSIAVYLEPWHSDIYDFLELKKNTGKEELRARDLFYGLWIPDLFMKRVEENGDWTLFCPNEAPGLSDVHSEDFEKLYLKYESEGLGRKSVKAQHLWFHILQSQIETGTPYLLYKDASNFKSNQKNLGTIKSSNLCCEIIEYTSKDEIAVCNLASIALNRYVNTENKTFDFEKLMNVTKTIVYNLNNVIDTNFYPVIETLKSNMRHRPIGIGVQGLADAFALMRYPFESEEASRLNSEIFACIYYAALEASCELASVNGTYSTFAGSPTSQGLLQFDLWNTKPIHTIFNSNVKLNWDHLKQQISQYGLRNSLLLAPMPTASTAQILGNNESIEPFTSNIYSRKVLSGEFPLVNKHLLRDLIERGLWNSRIRMQLLSSKGSVQNIPEIPNDLKELYKTVWEIKQKTLIDLSASRGVYVCQSQSLNLFVAEPTISKLSSMHFYTWKKGLKTGIYYLRTQPKADAIQFTVSLDGPVDDFKIKKSGIEDNKYKTREERAAAERAAIRAAIARGEYDDDESVCINCSG